MIIAAIIIGAIIDIIVLYSCCVASSKANFIENAFDDND